MGEYEFSKEVDPATITKLAPASFTTLPVRINKFDPSMRKISHEFMNKWHEACSAEDKAFYKDLNVISAQSPAGHHASLSFPELPPEKLSFATKAFDYSCIDDGTHVPQNPTVIHNLTWTTDLIQPRGSLEKFNAGKNRSLSMLLSTDPGLRRMQYSLAFEGMEMFNGPESSMMEAWETIEKYWEVRVKGVKECATLNDYVEKRYYHSGLYFLEELWSFFLGLSVTTEELKDVEHIIKPLRVAVLLSLDYFSYAKEKRNQEWDSRPIVHALPVVMAEHGMSEGATMDFIRARILEAEEEHTVALKAFEDTHSMPDRVREYIMAARFRTAGFHVWASCAPRYHNVVYGRNVDNVPSYTGIESFWSWITTSLGF